MELDPQPRMESVDGTRLPASYIREPWTSPIQKSPLSMNARYMQPSFQMILQPEPLVDEP